MKLHDKLYTSLFNHVVHFVNVNINKLIIKAIDEEIQ